MLLLMFLSCDSPFYLNQTPHITLVTVLIVEAKMIFHQASRNTCKQKKRKGKWADNTIKPVTFLIILYQPRVKQSTLCLI